MCYSDDALPPLPPIRGAAADSGDIELTSADGTRFGAYYARAAEPTGAGIVILPDVRGLHQFYKELTRRFAEAGVDAVAIDYFGRTAGIGPRDEGFDFQPHREQTTPAGIDADAAAGAAFLRSEEGGSVRSVFTVGFCFGGSNSWRLSATGPDIAGAIGFYGVPARVREYIPQMKSPLLLLVAGADHTPQEEFQLFEQELRDANLIHEMRTYEGAPHSFFDRTFAEHQAACDDAWRRMLDFIKKHSS